jgi:hypothetical protein
MLAQRRIERKRDGGRIDASEMDEREPLASGAAARRFNTDESRNGTLLRRPGWSWMRGW